MKGAVVFAVESGLGRQAKQFYDNGIFDTVLIHPHSHFTEHPEWYPNRVKDYGELLDKVDEIWFFETPFNWHYITQARAKGVKTVLVAMYECTHYPLPYFPDRIIGGSLLEEQLFKAEHINVPVPDEIRWKQRTKAKVFVHNAGHGGLAGRNGTRELIEALKYVKSPIKLLIRSQVPVKCDDPRVEVQIGDLPYEELFNQGDVFIYPDKFGGSCLPLQEAHASGMAVMASNRFPTNTWLPNEMLIPIDGYKKERIFREFDSAILDHKKIAETIDYWYDEDISRFSLAGKKWGRENSWKRLKPKYEKTT